ncbi:hypothetical protein SCOR_32915 [Sulfidibacter corallicola]|uniref:6-bladed beta-propeller n=1 Tax=Sulfidibacter corallicola TaxID=2818388 RepID=A0A8A4TJJ3_SULCO|nr:hypothetical protein [Sulfidibacter corallicola]QTD49657.1 hypothetical protein J3U87_29085 [Sulfidibacter corallicola]
MFFIAVAVLAVIPEWQVSVDYYMPLSSKSTVIDASGNIYTLNAHEPFVTQYSKEGKRLNNFVKKGEGPDSAMSPKSLYYIGDHLIIKDSKYFKKFSTDGVSVHAERLKSQKGFFVTEYLSLPVVNGWACILNPFYLKKDTPLLFIDNDAPPLTLMTLTELQSFGFDADAYSPCRPSYGMKIDRSGRFVYVKDDDEYKFWVFDMTTKKAVGTVHRALKPLFNPEWGESMFQNHIEESKEDLRIMGIDPNAAHHTERDFPTHCPGVRSWLIDPHGNLIVMAYSENPAVDKPVHGYNTKGEPIELKYSWEAYERILGFHGEFAYVATFDNDEEQAGIAKVKKQDVNAFVAKHPVIFKMTARHFFGGKYAK